MIKICGMTNSEGVEAAVLAGADAVGFVFHEASPRHQTIDSANALAEGVPAGVLKVAVMLHPDPGYAADVLSGFSPDVLQTDAEDFAHITVPAGTETWPVLRQGAGLPENLPATYLYEGQGSGTGETIDWQQAADVARQGRMILAGGLDAANVATAIRQVKPWGVDVSSAVESSRGVKDPEKIKVFVAAALAATKGED